MTARAQRRYGPLRGHDTGRGSNRAGRGKKKQEVASALIVYKNAK